MNKMFELGTSVRSFLDGLLGLEKPPTTSQPPFDAGISSPPRYAFGPRIDTSNLKHIYGPAQKVARFTPTPAGIDNLELTSTDVFEIPGMGEFTVHFKGYFQVARAEPTSRDWTKSQIFVNMTDLRLQGALEDLGTITVTLNRDIVSAGQVFPAARLDAAAACRIATAATFSLPQRNMTLFNKEPILLMNDAIESVPPVEDPNGEAYLYRLPLYNTKVPDGNPVAYLKSLKYTVGNYISESEANHIRASIR